MIGVYVAGASDPRERPRVRHVMDEIAGIEGVRLTYDWLADAEAAGPDSELSDQRLANAALYCMTGIIRASILLALVPAPGVETRGMWWELGYARRGADKRVMVSVSSDPLALALPFLRLPDVERYSLDSTALSEIRTAAIV